MIKTTAAMIKAYSKMGQKGAAAGVAMPALVQRGLDVLVVVADSVSIASLDSFQNAYPDRVVNVGVAEQNMIGVAAGIAAAGSASVFAFTYSSFIVARALEQVRINLSYHRRNVKLVGVAAGFTMEALGVSHWATEDIAFMRALPGITILSAADSFQAIKMILAAQESQGPMYIRLSGLTNCPIVYNEDFAYIIGKSIVHGVGSDACIVATGLMVAESLRAMELLAEKGIHCRVIDMHTIKPLDTQTLNNAFCNHSLVVTVEEHSVLGGLAGAVAEYRSAMNFSARHVAIGAADDFVPLGTQRYIWRHHGLVAEQIAAKVEMKLTHKCR